MRRTIHFHCSSSGSDLIELLLVMPHANVHDGDNTTGMRGWRGRVQGLIGRLVAGVGGMGRVHDLARQFLVFTPGKIGEDEMGQTVGVVAGLSHYV
jgi:hypothetical protein